MDPPTPGSRASPLLVHYFVPLPPDRPYLRVFFDHLNSTNSRMKRDLKKKRFRKEKEIYPSIPVIFFFPFRCIEIVWQIIFSTDELPLYYRYRRDIITTKGKNNGDEPTILFFFCYEASYFLRSFIFYIRISLRLFILQSIFC